MRNMPSLAVTAVGSFVLVAGLVATTPAAAADDSGRDDQSVAMSRVDEPTMATTSTGRVVELPAVSVDETHAATREGRNLLGLRPGESVSFVLDDAVVEVRVLAAGCTQSQSIANPSVVTAAPSGRAQSYFSLTVGSGCPTAQNLKGKLFYGSGLEKTAVESPLLSVPVGKTVGYTLGRYCSTSSQTRWQATMEWGNFAVATNSKSTSPVTLSCTP